MLAKLSEVCDAMVEVTDERRTTKVEKKKKEKKNFTSGAISAI